MSEDVKISLSTKFTLAFASLVLVSMIAVIFAVRRTTAARFRSQYENAVTTSLRALRTELSSRNQAIQKQLRRLGEQLRTDHKFRLQVLVRKDFQHRDVIDYAQAYMPTMGLSVLEIVNAEGVLLSSGHDRTSFGKQTGNFTSQLKSAEQEVQLAVFEKENQEIICLTGIASVEIANQKFDIVGGVAVDPNFLDELRLGQQEILILEIPDTPILSSSSEESAALALEVLKESDSANELFSVGRLEISLHKDGATTNVALYSMHPKTELTELLAALNRQILLIGGAVFVLTIALSIWLTRSVARPLRELASMASDLSLDTLDAEFELNGRDEVGVLNNALGEMQQGLRRGRVKLAAAEKKAAFAQIARQVNHDIKNGFIPIRNVMKHWQEVVEKEPQNLPQVFTERKSSVLESVDYLESLARSYSRLKPDLNLTAVDVNRVIANLVRNYDTGAESRVKFLTQYDAKQPRVQADQVQLHRAFENILHNALDALDGSGQISISTKLVGSHVISVWKDNGVGIPDEIRDQLFRPHVTTKENGSGLGLVNVKSIIEDFGGRVKIDSELGVGTTIEVSLPQMR